MWESVLISLNEQMEVAELLLYETVHGKFDWGHLDMDNPPWIVHLC